MQCMVYATDLGKGQHALHSEAPDEGQVTAWMHNPLVTPLVCSQVPPQHEEEFVSLFKTVHEIVEEHEPEVKHTSDACAVPGFHIHHCNAHDAVGCPPH